jgi:thiamine-monophosphate kinase
MTKKRVSDKESRLAQLGEFGLIRRLKTRGICTAPGILKGIDDDAAAVKIKTGITLITTDMLLEGIHFNLLYTTFYQLGYKALAVNMSDIFAMGGHPQYFLMSVGLPKTCTPDDMDNLYAGIRKIAKKYGVAVIGGDTCASKSGFVLNGTLIGNTQRIILRSGARVGDGIFVTQALGDSAMGLMLLKKMNKKASFEMSNKQSKLETSRVNLMKRHLMPGPAPLNMTRGVTAMIDISDGLLIDLSHICYESRVGAAVYRDKIPLSEDLERTARTMGIDPIKCALHGGEDYALLFTAPHDIKTNAFQIGEIINRGRYIIDSKGRKVPFRAEGYEHFKKTNYK